MSEAFVAIIGAGPYGLSLSATLTGSGVKHRIFGVPMHFWRTSAPPGMMLKSEGSSSDLFDPQRKFPIEQFYAERKLPYDDKVVIPRELFIEYGLEFQRRFVSQLDSRRVTSIQRDGDDFSVRLEDDSSFRASHVVVAVGIFDFYHVPEPLRSLPASVLSHSRDYGPVDGLIGKKVAVIGSGSSAVDLAWSLHERGIDVSILSRREKISFRRKPLPVTKWRHSLRSPDTPIGGGWKLWFYAFYPYLFRLLPLAQRLRIVATTLGPAPGWFMTEKVAGTIPIIPNVTLEKAEVVGEHVRLALRDKNAGRKDMMFDHVIAATGYHVDIERLSFLSAPLKREIATADGAPILSSKFESSAHGLYFVGAAAAASFGPVMRFVAGARYTVSALSAELSRRNARAEVVAPSRLRKI